MSKIPLVVIALGLGTVLVSGGVAWSSWNAARIRASWPETDAVIDTCSAARDPRTGYSSYHYYAHRTMPDGRRDDYDGYSSSCTPGPYRLRYDPENPTTLAYLEDDGSYFAAIIPAFIGFAFMFLGVRVLLAARRAPSAAAPNAPPDSPA